MIVMWVGEDVMARMLVPESARYLFGSAWLLALLFQPLNALAFGTDGIHWGTGDFRFLRDATVVATLVGGSTLIILSQLDMLTLSWVWGVTGAWIMIRVLFGVGRIWPGSTKAPLGRFASLPENG